MAKKSVKLYTDNVLDAFYDAMFEGDEERMLAANNAVGYYESMDGIACPEYPGF